MLSNQLRSRLRTKTFQSNSLFKPQSVRFISKSKLISQSTTSTTPTASTSTIIPPLPKKPRFYSRHPIIFSLLAAPIVLSASLGVIVAGLLAYDASTYTDRVKETVNLNPLSLNPNRGGKKNLKIAEVLVDDDDDKPNLLSKQKQKLVIIGGGWAGVGILKHLDPDEYHVTVVSPENYVSQFISFFVSIYESKNKIITPIFNLWVL